MSKHIFDVCSYKASIILKRFCQLINESDADIHIVMAQKAICLHELLVRNGELRKKEVYTNVAVEFGQIDFAGKKIAIIDDIIVSGAAISKIASKLVNLGVKLENIRIIALARDEQYQTIDFSGKDGISLLNYASSLNDADCISLSYEISQMISYFGMPYDADYPILKKNPISNTSTEWKLLFSSPLWETFDVTNDYHKEGNFTVLTLLPTSLMKSRLWESLGIDLAEWTHLKFRIYLSNALDGSAVMQVVPMALMNEIRAEDVSKLYDLYIKKVFQTKHIGENWELRTQFRFIQYFLAFKLLKLFTIELGIQDSLELDWNAFTIQTGIRNTQILEEVFSANYSVIKKSDYCFSELGSRIDSIRSQNPELRSYSVDAQNNSVDESLLAFFIERHTTDEMIARKKLKHPIKHFIRDAETIDDISQSLRKGFSLHDLMYLVSSYNGQYDLEQVVTIFIDRAIDSGIVVPIIYVNKDEGFISRAYRHGEDLPFGKADEDRLIFFVASLNSELKKRNIESVFATITFEKILVLFYQVGLRGKIFNRFLGFDEYPLLREQFCVHGAVMTHSTSASVHLYVDQNPTGKSQDDDSGEWLRAWLVSKQAIYEKTDGIKHHIYINEEVVSTLVSDRDLNNIDNEIQNFIEKIAGVIAVWYSLFETSKDEFKADIISLTSCSDSYAFASSLIAEIRYFKKYWDNQYKEAISYYIQTGEESSFEYHPTKQALYSGREKEEWYRSDRASVAIKKVQNILEKRLDLDAYRFIWKDIWEFRKKTTTPISDELLTEGLCYLYIFSLWYQWLTQYRILHNTKNEGTFLESDQTAKALWDTFVLYTTKTTAINANQVIAFSKLEAEESIPARIQMFTNCVENMLCASEAYVSRVEQEIRKSNQQYSVQYKSCVIVDLLCPINACCDQLMLKVWDSVEECREKTDLNIISFGKKEQYYRYGLFYDGEIKDTSLNNPLFRMYQKVLAEAISHSYLTRAIYIPYLPQSISFKHNLKMHIHKYTEDFSINFLDKLTFSFVNTDVHQILFVQRSGDDTDEDQVQSFFSCATKEFHGKVYREGMSVFIGRLYRLSQPLLEDSSSKLKNSIVAIKSNDSTIATGLLFVYKGITYCVTCAHVKSSNGKLYARLRNTSHIIELKLLYGAELSPSGHPLIDVAIYEPQWAIDTPLNINRLIGETDYVRGWSEASEISYFKCFGYRNGAHFGDFVSLKLNGDLEGGYYSLSIVSSDDVVTGSEGVIGQRLNGLSGAPVYDSETEKVLGIHSCHNNEIIAGAMNTRCVSIQEIVKYLENL